MSLEPETLRFYHRRRLSYTLVPFSDDWGLVSASPPSTLTPLPLPCLFLFPNEHVVFFALTPLLLVSSLTHSSTHHHCMFPHAGSCLPSSLVLSIISLCIHMYFFCMCSCVILCINSAHRLTSRNEMWISHSYTRMHHIVSSKVRALSACRHSFRLCSCVCENLCTLWL